MDEQLPIESVEQQLNNNRQTKDAWERYAEHRLRLFRLIDSAANELNQPSLTVCILGAGNCNDLDLGLLSQRFSQITLIDLDREAIEQGIRRQHSVHSNFDKQRIEVIAPLNINDPLLKIKEAIRSKPFDVVVSAGLLTQIIQTILGNRPPTLALLQKLIAARSRHFELLAAVVRRPGVIVFATDVVSSLTAPEIEFSASLELPRLLQQLISSRNFFTGASPQGLLEEIGRLSEFTNGAKVVEHPPWCWPVVPGKTFLVWAATIFVGTQQRSVLDAADLVTDCDDGERRG